MVTQIKYLLLLLQIFIRYLILFDNSSGNFTCKLNCKEAYLFIFIYKAFAIYPELSDKNY